MLVYIEYYLLNQLLDFLPYTDIKYIIFFNIAKKIFHQKFRANRKLNVKHKIL